MSSTSPGLGTIAAALGAGLQLAAQLREASAAQRIARYNAAVADANAERQAQAAEIEAGQFERQADLSRQDEVALRQAQAYREARTREQHARILGVSRAIVASSGLLLTGSPLAVFEETVRQQELDILTQRYQGALQARALGEDVTQREYAADVVRYSGAERLRIGRQQAATLRAQGDEAGRGGLLRAVGIGVQGVAGTYAAYQREQYQRSGPASPSLLSGTAPRATSIYNPYS